MSFSTFSGPLRAGTIKDGTVASGRNTGNPVLAQTATVNMSGVALTAAPPAQLLFNLPAGAKIIRFAVEKTVAISGGGVTEVNVTFGTTATANLYLTSTALGLTTGTTSGLTAAQQVTATNNIGTVDVPVRGTFTAATGNPTAGTVVVTVEYIQRADDGSAAPVAA